CLQPYTNGVVFGNYYAEKVALHDCRNGFMFSEDSRTEIEDSTVDGVPFEISSAAGAEGTSSPSPSPVQDPSPSPSSESRPSAEPEPSPTSEPEPSDQGVEPEFSGFPNANNTGVPQGT